MTPTELAKSGTEHAQQRALFAWTNMAANLGAKVADYYNEYNQLPTVYNDNPIPELKWLHAIHNQGNASAIQGARAKAEGVKAGIWDIFLPVCLNGHCGLYIEMKVGKNTLTKEQSEFGEFARNQGYKTVICHTWIEAKDAILKYLGLI